MWVGQAEFIYFLGELSWGSGSVYLYISLPTYFEHFEWRKWLIGLAQSFEISLKTNGHRFETDLIRAGQGAMVGGTLILPLATRQVT